VGVGDGGGKPGNGARVWRFLDVDKTRRPSGDSTTITARVTVATGGAARYSGGVFLRISRRRKTRYGEFE
jgi:hypothetical protein